MFPSQAPCPCSNQFTKVSFSFLTLSLGKTDESLKLLANLSSKNILWIVTPSTYNIAIYWCLFVVERFLVSYGVRHSFRRSVWRTCNLSQSRCFVFISFWSGTCIGHNSLVLTVQWRNVYCGQNWVKVLKTRMHSSRIRTARTLP